MTEETQVTETQPTQQTTAPIELTVNDLQSLRAIVDLASVRGAFRPNEMVAVGQTYTKLETFLDNVTKQSEANQAAQGAA